MKALVMSEPGNVKMTELPMPEMKPDGGVGTCSCSRNLY